MKKIVLIIFCLFFYGIFTINTQAISDDSSIKNKDYYSQFDLLEKYLTGHKQKIEKFQKKYNIYSNTKLTLLLKEIDNLRIISKKIKNKNIDGVDKKNISLLIIKRIKIINTDLQKILTQEKNNYQILLKNKKNIYNEIGVKAGNQLINIIENLVGIVKKSTISVEKKMKIFIHLKNLQKNSKKLRDFKNNNFENEKTMQGAFISILKEIRDDMASIKRILKNK